MQLTSTLRATQLHFLTMAPGKSADTDAEMLAETSKSLLFTLANSWLNQVPLPQWFLCSRCCPTSQQLQQLTLLVDSILAFYCLFHNVNASRCVEERAPPDRHEDQVCRWLLVAHLCTTTLPEERATSAACRCFDLTRPARVATVAPWSRDKARRKRN